MKVSPMKNKLITDHHKKLTNIHLAAFHVRCTELALLCLPAGQECGHPHELVSGFIRNRDYTYDYTANENTECHTK